MIRLDPATHACRVSPGCPGLAVFGFFDPRAKERRTLWACREHKGQAEARWAEATGQGERPFRKAPEIMHDPLHEGVAAPVQGVLL